MMSWHWKGGKGSGSAMSWPSQSGKGWAPENGKGSGSAMSWPSQSGKGWAPENDQWGSSQWGVDQSWGSDSSWGGGAWESTGSGDAWGHHADRDGNSSSGARGGPRRWKNYQSYTHLGMGRHRLPHEDRCALACMLLEEIHQDTSVKIPNMVVASWKEVTCNAFFFLLSNTQPSSRLQ